MTDSLALPLGLLSLDDWDALPEDALPRCELVEGNLLVAPSPAAGHQRVCFRIARWLDDVLPDELDFLLEQDLLCDPGSTPTVRRPDITVVRAGLPDRTKRIDPRDAVGVIEIVSPGSYRTDRIAKTYDYAEAGIGWYLIADPEVRTLTLFARPAGGGPYDCVARDVRAVDLPAIGTLRL